MQSLRDKLLKSGLVDKKTARKVKTEQRRKKKQKGGAGKVDTEQAERREAAFAERQAAEAQAARKQAAEQNAAREARERGERLRNIIERHCLVKVAGDQRQFCFVGLDGKTIKRLMTSYRVGERIASGEVAIVAAPYDAARGYRLVERAVAERVEQLGPQYILFWNRDSRT